MFRVEWGEGLGCAQEGVVAVPAYNRHMDAPGRCTCLGRNPIVGFALVHYSLNGPRLFSAWTPVATGVALRVDILLRNNGRFRSSLGGGKKTHTRTHTHTHTHTHRERDRQRESARARERERERERVHCSATSVLSGQTPTR
jgi:hypothetical protein